MKKLLYICLAFAVGSLLQLISGTVFLFAGADAITEAVIQTVLLLVTAFVLIGGEIYLNHLNNAGELDDEIRGLAFQANRLAGILLTIETVSVVMMAVAAVFSVPVWVHAVPVLAMVLACIVGGLAVFRAIHVRKDENVDEALSEEENA